MDPLLCECGEGGLLPRPLTQNLPYHRHRKQQGVCVTILPPVYACNVCVFSRLTLNSMATQMQVHTLLLLLVECTNSLIMNKYCAVVLGSSY